MDKPRNTDIDRDLDILLKRLRKRIDEMKHKEILYDSLKNLLNRIERYKNECN